VNRRLERPISSRSGRRATIRPFLWAMGPSGRSCGSAPRWSLPVTRLRSAVVEGDVQMLAVGTDRKLARHRGAAAPGRIRQRL